MSHETPLSAVAENGAEGSGAQATIAEWTCPMHPEVLSDQAGTCPECHMALEPRSLRSQSDGATPAGQEPCGEGAGRIEWPLHRELRGRAIGWGVLAGSVLIGVYAATLGLTNSFEHALDELARLWPWMLPLVLGFSVQVGLFAYARRATRKGGYAAHARGVVASGGASTVSMIACCAHHVTDVLPIVGLAGAVTVLAAYQELFLLLGVLSNLVGLVYVLGLLRKHRLFPSRTSGLSLVLRWPVDRALGPAVILAAVVLITSLLSEWS